MLDPAEVHHALGLFVSPGNREGNVLSPPRQTRRYASELRERPISRLRSSQSSAPAYAAFAQALDDPSRAQEMILRRYLRENADTAFGREHGFAEIRTAEQFARRRVEVVDGPDRAGGFIALLRGRLAVAHVEVARRPEGSSGDLPERIVARRARASAHSRLIWSDSVRSSPERRGSGLSDCSDRSNSSSLSHFNASSL